MLLHALLIAIMLSTILESRSRAKGSVHTQAIQVSLINEPETAEITPPQPIVPPQQITPLNLAPTPLPIPEPVTKSSPKPSTAQAPAASASAAKDASKTSQDSQDLEDVMGRFRDNWLEPPGINANFRCKLRIDYAVGGKITAVNFLKGCGALALDDSVKRAIWKTQTLPLQNAKSKAGSIEIDFTP